MKKKQEVSGQWYCQQFDLPQTSHSEWVWKIKLEKTYLLCYHYNTLSRAQSQLVHHRLPGQGILQGQGMLEQKQLVMYHCH